MERFMKLQEMGREPIALPEQIYFAGNITLQKTPGNHHLPQYRKTGTYNHPALRAMRKREALDMAKRLINNKLTEVSLRKIGGLVGLQERLSEFGLKIDNEQMEVAQMNAHALEEDGKAKHQMREEQKMLEMAKLGIAYKPLEAEKTPFSPKEQVNAVIRAQKAKPAPADDLSSRDDSEKDNNELDSKDAAALATQTGVMDTGNGDLDVKVIEA
jgi:hypothetical protein